MKNDVSSEMEISTASVTAMTSELSESKSHVTPTEQQKFLSAMKDSTLRILLNDYMHDITDVHNHDETVHRSSQLQNKPKDKQLIQITPGFVVKTKYDNKHKVFINVCSSDKMQPPTNSTKATDCQSLALNLPYSIGPERLEADKGGTDVPTFDVCFHPQVVEFAMAQADYRHMVVSTCLEVVELAIRDFRCKPRAILARKYHILKGVFYKSGDPVPMCLGRTECEVTELSRPKTVKEVQSKDKTKVDLSQDKITMLDDKELITRAINQADDLELTQVEQADDSTPLIKEKLSTELDLKQKAEKLKQKKLEYQLVYRGRFEHFHDLQVEPNNPVSGDGYRPKELVVKVSFPFSTSAKGIDLDVSERMLRLSTDVSVVGDYEPLELTLPFPVVEDKGCASFDRTKRKLVVTLPVQPPPKPKPQSFSLIVQDDDEEEQELPRNIVATHKSSEVFDDLLLVESYGGEEVDTLELIAVETESSKSMSASIGSAPEAVVDPIKPSFETHDTLKCLSYIVSVAGIDWASVKLTFPSNCSLGLQFSDSDKQVYELHVAVLPVDIDPSTAEFDVASENMVVILYKKYAATASASQTGKLEDLDALAQNQLLNDLD